MENDKVLTLFIPVRKGMMQQMKAFYGGKLNFMLDGSAFLINNIPNIRGQLQYSQVDIDAEKNPLFQFNLVNNFPDYCGSLRDQGVHFDFVAMTPGGYIGKLVDPSGNSLLIACDSFESSSNVDITSWNEYKRY